MRARGVAKLLILYDLRPGGMIRCLGGIYTSDFLNFASINACPLAISDIPVNPREPLHNSPVLQQLFHQHTPFKASLQSARRVMLFRNHYNNHRSSNPYPSSIHKNAATDIQKSYSTALPRLTLRFVSEIFLAALGYDTRKHKGKVKGRQVNDPSGILSGPNEYRALNSHIDRRYPVVMPLVHYQSALQCLWRRVYNLCLNHPEECIIIYKEDLVSTFRRLHYHPDVAAACTFVLGAYLFIPAGMVFGSIDFPYLFCLLSKLISFAS